MFQWVQKRSVSPGLGTLVAGVAAGIFPAGAIGASISSGNSSLTINPTGPGAYITSWTVDGVNQFGGTPAGGDHIQFFNGSSWVGINTLTVQGTPFFGSGISSVTYGGVFEGYDFTINVRDTLSGGVAGSGSSGISEQITVTNPGAVPQPGDQPALVATPIFEIQDVVDYSVNGNAANNTLTLSPGPNPNTGRQTEAGATVTYAATPVPEGWSLMNNSTGENALGPVTGNEAFSFSWELPIAPGDGAAISITEAASGVSQPSTSIPLPSAGWASIWTLGGLGVFGVIKRVRRIV